MENSGQRKREKRAPIEGQGRRSVNVNKKKSAM